MKEQLLLLWQNCQKYIKTYEALLKQAPNTLDAAQKAAYLQIKEYQKLIKQISAQQKAKKEENSNAVAEFNELYNKNFDYLNKFTSQPQANLKFLLHYHKLVDNLDSLYKQIPQKTLDRQGKLLSSRKKAVDKWLKALDVQLKSKELQAPLEKRFWELVKKANVSLAEKGLAAISIPANVETV
ncbi:MAG: hypothetical protein GY810_09950 [Aureispira sp.]|nr:hypothetical protein [Aureispira sp.]